MKLKIKTMHADVRGPVTLWEGETDILPEEKSIIDVNNLNEIVRIKHLAFNQDGSSECVITVEPQKE